MQLSLNVVLSSTEIQVPAITVQEPGWYREDKEE